MVFDYCSDTSVIDKDERCLSKTFVEYIDGVRIYLEGESNGDLPILQDIRLHFSKFVRHLICNTPGKGRHQLGFTQVYSVKYIQ